MEDKNELSDIILEKDDNKSMKIKRILIIAALMILVFLVVLVVMRVINKPNPTSNTSKLILPPQPITKQVEQQKEDDLFKQVPIVEEEDKKESFEEMVKSLKDKEIKKQEIIEPNIEQIKEQLQEKVIAKIEPKQIVETKKVEPKQVAKKIEKINTSTVATKGVYIQVGATLRLTPSKKFLAQIAVKDYGYRLLPIDINGKKVTKILVGPYANTTEAKQVLADIKTNINKDAFIYRVK